MTLLPNATGPQVHLLQAALLRLLALGRLLQQDLERRHRLTLALEVERRDERFGPVTVEVVLLLRVAHGLPAVAEVDDELVALLDRLLNEVVPEIEAPAPVRDALGRLAIWRPGARVRQLTERVTSARAKTTASLRELLDATQDVFQGDDRPAYPADTSSSPAPPAPMPTDPLPQGNTAMTPISAPLPPGSTGTAVGNLQAALAALLERDLLLSGEPELRAGLVRDLRREQRRATYGEVTQRLVDAFQQERGLSNGGAVDEPTAEALNRLLAELGLLDEAPPERVVHGRARYWDGRPVGGGVVRVDWLPDPRLAGDTITDAEGRYHVVLDPAVEGTALRVVLFDAAGAPLAESPPLEAPGLDVPVDFILPQELSPPADPPPVEPPPVEPPPVEPPPVEPPPVEPPPVDPPSPIEPPPVEPTPADPPPPTGATFNVTVRVLWRNRAPLPGCEARIGDVTLIPCVPDTPAHLAETPLAQGVTDADGRRALAFFWPPAPPAELLPAAAAGKPAPDLRLRVFSPEGLELHVSPLYPAAARDLHIEVVLDTDAVRPEVENAVLIARLTRRLPGAERCMAEVPDDALPLLARDSGLDELRLRQIRDVARLRAAPAGGEAISASTAWAMLRAGLPADPISWLDLPRADLVAPIRRALDDALIAPVSDAGRDPRSPEQRATDAEARADAFSTAMIAGLSQDAPGQERHPFVAVLRIAGVDSSERIVSWMKHYQARSPDAKGATWWDGLAEQGFSAPEVGRIQDAHLLYRVLGGDVNALRGVSAQLDPQDGPVSLLAWAPARWEGLLAAAGRTDVAARADEAAQLTDAVRELWRSEAQRRALRDRPWGARVFGEVAMGDALGLLVDGVAAADQDFTEVALTSLVDHPALERWRALEQPIRATSVREGEALQRVARVADHPQTLAALWPEFQSAAQIARLPVAALAQRLEGLTLAEPVEKVHARAAEKATIAMHMGLQLANYAGYGGVAGGASPGDRPASGELLQNLQLPSVGLQELVGSMAWCACGSCSSVLSPAAYLVDLLALLQQIKDKDGETLEARLLARRRDIALIPLDCANTNTEVPYIDLMNEAMECLFLIKVVKKDEQGTEQTKEQKYLPARFDDGGRSAAEARAMPGFRVTENWDWIARRPRFPTSLPYHDGVAAERAWLAQLGTSRAEVLQLWSDATGGASPHRLAMETLGLYALGAEWALPAGEVSSLGEKADASTWSLLVVPPSQIADAHTLLGLPNAAALSGLQRLDRMAAALELDTSTLLSRLDLWYYSAQIDASGVATRVQLLQEQGAGEIFDCRPDHTRLDVSPLPFEPWAWRVRFFERLVKLTGWTPEALDQYLHARQLFDPYASPERARQELMQLAATLRLCRGGAELETLTWLGWRPENRPYPEALSAALAVGADRQLALRRLLRVSAPVLTAMRAQINTGLTEPMESEAWDLVRMAGLGRLLDVSPLDVLPLLGSFELKSGPMEPDQLERLAHRWARLSRRGFTVRELRAIWQGQDRGAAGLGDKQVAALLSTLERQLQVLNGKPNAASEELDSKALEAEAASQSLREGIAAALGLSEEVVVALLRGREDRLLALRAPYGEPNREQVRTPARLVLNRLVLEARVVARLGLSALEIEALCLRQAPMGVWPTEPTLLLWWDLILRWADLRDQVLGGDAGVLDVRLASYGPAATEAERQDLTRPLALRLGALAGATGWPDGMIEALVQADTDARGLPSQRAFGWADQLSDGATPGLLSRLPELLTLIELGGLSARSGVSPRVLGQIYTSMPSMADHDARVALLRESAQARTPEDRWWDVVRAVHDPLRVTRRAALAAVLCDGTHGPVRPAASGTPQVITIASGSPADNTTYGLRVIAVGMDLDETVTYTTSTSATADQVEVALVAALNANQRFYGVASAVAGGGNAVVTSRDHTVDITIAGIDIASNALLTITEPTRKVRTPAELFQAIYFDPGMGPCQLTTRIRQATIAVQQLVQSVQLGEEPGCDEKHLPPEWTWIRNYRVWEAARKVFLYPEKYYAADLRVGMTEIFRDLVAELGVSELDSGTKLALMRRYTERLHDVSDLETIALWTDTSNVVFSSEQPTHHILARTHAAPHRYFYRVFREEEEWTPWESVPVTPEGVHTMLVRVEKGGPLWLMWFTFEDRPVANDPRSKEEKEADPEPPMEWWITPYWSEKTEDGWGEAKRGETVRVTAVYGEDSDSGKPEGLIRAEAEYDMVQARVAALEGMLNIMVAQARQDLRTFLGFPFPSDNEDRFVHDVDMLDSSGTLRTPNEAAWNQTVAFEVAFSEVEWDVLSSETPDGRNSRSTPRREAWRAISEHWDETAQRLAFKNLQPDSGIHELPTLPIQSKYSSVSNEQAIRSFVGVLVMRALGKRWRAYDGHAQLLQEVNGQKGALESEISSFGRSVTTIAERRASFKKRTGSPYTNAPTTYTPLTNDRRISLVPTQRPDSEPTRLVLENVDGAHWAVEPCRGTIVKNEKAWGVHAYRNVPHDAENDGARLFSREQALRLSKDSQSVKRRTTAPVLYKQGAGRFTRRHNWGTLGVFSEPAFTFEGDAGSWLVTRTHDQGPDFLSASDLLGQLSKLTPVLAPLSPKPPQTLSDGSQTEAAITMTFTGSPSSKPWLRFWAYHHPYACELSQAVREGGAEALYRWDVQRLGEPREPRKPLEPEIGYLFYRAHSPSEATVSRWYPEQNLDFSAGGAYSVYNWELYLHLPLLLAETYHAAGRYEDELEVLTWLLDPLARPTAGDPVEAKVPEARAWRLRPLHDHVEQQDIATRLRALSDPTFAKTIAGMATIEAMRQEIASWRRDPFDVWRILGGRLSGIKRLLFYRWFHCHLAIADQLYRRISGPNGMEEVARAHQRYLYLQRCLGQRAQAMPELKRGAGLTWKEIQGEGQSKLDSFQNLAVALETHIVSTVPVGGGAPQPLMQLYFCVPPDPDLLKLWDTVEDRLWKIRNCRDIDGVQRSYPIWGIEIDPMLLVRARALGLDFDEVLGALADPPSSPRRFTALLATAKGMVSHLMSLQGAWLSAREKKSAEELNLLRGQQEVALTRAVIDLKKTAVAEARTNLSALRQVQTSVQMKIAYYERLLGERNGDEKLPMNGYEASSLSKQKQAGEKAKDIQRGQSLLDFLLNSGTFTFQKSETIGFHPSTTIGYSLTASTGGLAALGRASVAEIGGFAVDELRSESARAEALGKHQRREQEWNHALDQARVDLRKVERDLDAQDLRVQIAEHDLRNSDLQAQHAREVLAHYQNRFTNAELYRKMDARLATLHRQAQELAEGMVRRVKNQVRFELGEDFVAELTPAGTQPRGLLRGEELMNDLLRIESAWMEHDVRRFELTKEIPLSRVNPEALLKLRHGEGSAEFELPEELFDQDYPGHYDRRIRSVSLSIPCVAGPYTGVHATLHLQKSLRRPLAGADQEIRDVPVSVIATSGGRDDNGLFQLDLRDERYLPFEGAGAHSFWKLEMPQEDNAFDLRSVADVIMRISFTARDAKLSAAELSSRRKARIGADATRPVMDATMFSLRSDFPERWAELRRRATFEDLEITIPEDRLPFRKGKHEVHAVALQLISAGDPPRLPTGWTVNKTGEGNEPTLGGTLIRLPEPTLQLRLSGAWGTTPKDALADVVVVVRTHPMG